MGPLGLGPLGQPYTVPEEDDAEELRLPTALAVLALCYVTNHIPVLVSLHCLGGPVRGHTTNDLGDCRNTSIMKINQNLGN